MYDGEYQRGYENVGGAGWTALVCMRVSGVSNERVWGV